MLSRPPDFPISCCFCASRLRRCVESGGRSLEARGSCRSVHGKVITRRRVKDTSRSPVQRYAGNLCSCPPALPLSLSHPQQQRPCRRADRQQPGPRVRPSARGRIDPEEPAAQTRLSSSSGLHEGPEPALHYAKRKAALVQLLLQACRVLLLLPPACRRRAANTSTTRAEEMTSRRGCYDAPVRCRLNVHAC